ncbi:polysaccharide deacetylase family protein [Nibribacter ruber]|uniref:Polysaccharide deacetylase family protein n=1 Tax=Nibribacter ruber TaxID=2698458 RepID=A0A6P1NS34_9BACT|nr:polysaccharide deacetylase family protein [Nibribacter ruber]QHL86646.1 polysaccharide deacetylase family protein [Nibribacter ruber]
MRFFQTPAVFSWLFPRIWWHRKTAEKVLYLTFDDGPIPDVTEFVLNQLALYQAKATFFCVGENLERNPAIAEMVYHAGHTLANHTHKHVQAWKTPVNDYLLEVERCQSALNKVQPTANSSMLFRPPHGQLTLAHLKRLQEKYQVVMWSHLTYDFDQTLPPEKCWDKLKGKLRPGAILVMHDSLKAERNLRFVLPRLLQHAVSLGYSFKAL